MRRVAFIVCLMLASVAMGQGVVASRAGAAGTRAATTTRGAAGAGVATRPAATGAAAVTKNLDRRCRS